MPFLSTKARRTKEWVAALDSTDEAVRIGAASKLAFAGDQRGFDVLNHVLTSSSPQTRISAAVASEGLHDFRILPGLKAALAHESALVRAAAVSSLDRSLLKEALQPLIEALDDEAAGVQEAAANALARHGDSTAVAPLIRVLTSPEARVRAAAVRALGYIGDSKAGPAVTEALNDPDERVRARAAEELDRSKLREWAHAQGMYPTTTGRCPACGEPVAMSGDANVELCEGLDLEMGAMVWTATVRGSCGGCGARICRSFREGTSELFREVDWYREE